MAFSTILVASRRGQRHLDNLIDHAWRTPRGSPAVPVCSNDPVMSSPVPVRCHLPLAVVEVNSPLRSAALNSISPTPPAADLLANQKSLYCLLGAPDFNSVISDICDECEGSNSGGNEVGADVGKGGGASGLVGESMKGSGNGSEWEVAAASALIRICDAGGGDIASSLATSDSGPCWQELGAPPPPPRQSQHPSRHPHPPHRASLSYQHHHPPKCPSHYIRHSLFKVKAGIVVRITHPGSSSSSSSGLPQDQTPAHNQVIVQWVRHPQHSAWSSATDLILSMLRTWKIIMVRVVA
ncbi:hypothetical protein Tco_0750040 [Tanacetum coccineum]|uniref:Uncharacterized protein n=1 Tax=Tanacetum coccineum TaxID=301880 RepID=A0ABQ4Z043_9ASTR